MHQKTEYLDVSKHLYSLRYLLKCILFVFAFKNAENAYLRIHDKQIKIGI